MSLTKLAVFCVSTRLGNAWATFIGEPDEWATPGQQSPSESLFPPDFMFLSRMYNLKINLTVSDEGSGEHSAFSRGACEEYERT